MNLSFLKPAIIFLTGAAAGGTVAWTIAKRKYEAIADEEIESVYARMDKYRKAHDKAQMQCVDLTHDMEEERKAYKKILKDHGISTYEIEEADLDYYANTPAAMDHHGDPIDEDDALDDEEEDEYPTEDTGEFVVTSKEVDTTGHIITKQEYETENLHYKKLETIHYMRGGHFVTEEGDQDASEFFLPLIREGKMKKFMGNKNAECWVRFDGFETDYHIIHKDKTYLPNNK